MNIMEWKSFIDNNFETNKLRVLHKLVQDGKIQYQEFHELLKYIQKEYK